MNQRSPLDELMVLQQLAGFLENVLTLAKDNFRQHYRTEGDQKPVLNLPELGERSSHYGRVSTLTLRTLHERLRAHYTYLRATVQLDQKQNAHPATCALIRQFTGLNFAVVRKHEFDTSKLYYTAQDGSYQVLLGVVDN